MQDGGYLPDNRRRLVMSMLLCKTLAGTVLCSLFANEDIEREKFRVETGIFRFKARDNCIVLWKSRVEIHFSKE